MNRHLYTLALWLALPYVLARLWWRGRTEPGYREHVAERFGVYGERPDGPVIWLHAVSVGETRAAEPLVKALMQRYPDHRFVITQMTATGRATAEQLFGGIAQLCYLPYDYPFAVRRFLAHFRPSLGIIMETEIWFNLVHGCASGGVPVLLANARMSEKSARGYHALAGLTRGALGALAAIAAQSAADAERLVALGAGAVEVTGNLKFDIPEHAREVALGAELRGRFGEKRPVLVAASTREGEEELLIEALNAAPIPNLLSVIVPRHPQRFDEVASLIEGAGRRFARRSDNRPVPADCEFVLGDSLGEMGAYYRACDVAFVGGSLIAYGGQNFIEACAAGRPVLFGPHTYNFSQASEDALAVGAAIRVADAHALVRVLASMLDDQAMLAAMSDAGRRFCDQHRGATARMLAICERLLEKKKGG